MAVFIFPCCANGAHPFSSGGSASHGVIKKAYPEILAGFVVSPGAGRNAGDPLSRRRLLASHQVHTTLRPSQTTIRSFTVFLLAQFCFAGKVE